ncbi:MAG TPA: RCC1 domain-containing protein [Labilithrix sp.]|nr:RCC1 domain-containing protein [Labilithrix sp.]
MTTSRLAAMLACLAIGATTTACGLLAGVDWDRVAASGDGGNGGNGGSSGTTGGPSDPSPPGLSGIRDLSIDGDAACVVRDNGTLACFGGVPPPPAGTFRAVSVSDGYGNCAIAEDGTLQCWGGDATEGTATDHPPAGGGITAVRVGAVPCVLQNGRIVCWGKDRPADAAMASFAGTVWAELGGPYDICAVSNIGDIRCFESKPSIARGRGLASSGVDNCILDLASSKPACWSTDGSAAFGQPLPPPDEPLRSIALGAPGVGCGIRMDDSVKCWATRQLGATVGPDPSILTAVPSGAFRKVAVGQYFGCAIRTSGELVCWGPHARLVGP